SGALEFHRLDLGERPLALQYGFRHNNCFLLLQEAYDPDWESVRPGIALRGFRLRSMIADGVREYDFLGGVAQHKLDWGASAKQAFKKVAGEGGVAQAPAEITSESKLKSALAWAYASTPVGALGRSFANRYRRATNSMWPEKRTQPTCQILLYHRINDDRDPFLPSMPVDQFRRQMEYVARNFKIVI